MDTILVICTANVCRSPMAQVLLQRALPDVRVLSAGLEAMPGMPADRRAAALMASEGLDLAGHRAQTLSPWMLDASYLVLTMSARQKRVIERRHPAARGRVFRLLDESDVSDPYRKGADAYAETLQNLREGVDRWSWRLSRLASESRYAAADASGLSSGASA